MRGVQVDMLAVLASDSSTIGESWSLEQLMSGTITQMVNSSVQRCAVEHGSVANSNGDSESKLLASLWVLRKAHGVSLGVLRGAEARIEVIADNWALYFSRSDGHPAKFRLGAFEGESNNAHHVRTRRFASGLEGAAQKLVNSPIVLLTDGTAVVDVLATATEFARLRADSAVVVDRRHGGVSYCDVIVMTMVCCSC